MEVGVPQLELCLEAAPVGGDEQAVYDASAMVIGAAGKGASGLGGVDDGRGEDVGVRLGDAVLGKLARNDLLDLIFETKGDDGDLLGRNGRGDEGFAVGGEEGLQLVVEAASITVVPVEESITISMPEDVIDLGVRDGKVYLFHRTILAGQPKARSLSASV